MLTPFVWITHGPVGLAWVGVAALVFPLLRRLGLWAGPRQLDFAGVDMRGKVAIVTGCNTGIGFHTALNIAKMGATVVMACRCPRRAKHARDRMEEMKADLSSKEYPYAKEGSLVCLPLDLSSLASVKHFATEFRKKFTRLDALVCNAGLANTPGKSADGFDLMWATNYLGHFYLVKLLLDVLKATEGGARVVNVSSLMHEFGCTDFEGSLAGRYSSLKDKLFSGTYNDSKLAMVLFTLALNERLKRSSSSSSSTTNTNTGRVRAIAVSPGAVYSDIWRGFGKYYRRLFLDPVMTLLFLSNEQGCRTSVYAATHPLEEDDAADGEREDTCPYYMPYFSPGRDYLFFWEAMGPYNGYTRVRPRLPTNARQEAERLWWVSEKALLQHGHGS